MNNDIIVLDRLEQVSNELKTFMSGNTVVMLRHQKNGTVHNLVPANIGLLEGLSFCMFVAADNFNSGDTITMDGKATSIKLNHSASLDGLFVAGDCVSLSYDSNSSTIFIMNPHEYTAQKHWEISPLLGDDEYTTTWICPENGVYRVVFISAGCIPSKPATMGTSYSHVVSGVPGVGGPIVAGEYEIAAETGFVSLSINSASDPTPPSLPTDPMDPSTARELIREGNEYVYFYHLKIGSVQGRISNTVSHPHQYGYTYLPSDQSQGYTFAPGESVTVQELNLLGKYEYAITEHSEDAIESDFGNSTYRYVPPIPGGKVYTPPTMTIPYMLKPYITDEQLQSHLEYVDNKLTMKFDDINRMAAPLLGDQKIHCYGLGLPTGVGYLGKFVDHWQWLSSGTIEYPIANFENGVNNWGVIIDKIG